MIHCDIGAMVKSLKENGCKRHVTRTIKCNVYQNSMATIANRKCPSK